MNFDIHGIFMTIDFVELTLKLKKAAFCLHFDFSNRHFLAIQVSNLPVGCVQRKFQIAVTY